MSDILTVVNMIPSLSSGETNQDSEPNLAVNPANPLEMAATAFTPSPNSGSTNSPIFYSSDGGNTWSLKDIIAGTPVRDQTLRFAATSGILYAGVLWGTGNNIALINFDILRTNDFSGLTTMTQLAQRKNDDQPFVQAATVPSGPNTGKDRIYVGSNDHAPANIPATIDLSLDAALRACDEYPRHRGPYRHTRRLSNATCYPSEWYGLRDLLRLSWRYDLGCSHRPRR